MAEEPIVDPLVERFYWEMVEGLGKVLRDPSYVFRHDYIKASEIQSFFFKIGGTFECIDSNGWEGDTWYAINYQDKKYTIFTSAFNGGVEFSLNTDDD